MYPRRDHRKKPWKNVNRFSKAIKNIFSHMISFPSSPSKWSDEPKSFYCPIKSRYECPCDYHGRQRDEQRPWFEAHFSQQHHHKTAEEIQLHGEENNAIFEYKDDQQNGSSLNDACANLVKSLQQVNDVDVSDVDKRAEEFIKQFREQLRNSKISYEN